VKRKDFVLLAEAGQGWIKVNVNGAFDTSSG
jgi:hypothetical protein